MSEQAEAQHQREARLSIVLPTGDAFERKVTKAQSHLGRGAHNDILIIDPEVSVTHALLAFYDDSYLILDEGSEGGTYVNGEPLTKPRKLFYGDVIKMGKSQITFTLKHGGAETAPSSDAEGPKEEQKKDKKDKKDKRPEKMEERSSVVAAEALSIDTGSEEKKKKKDAKKGKSGVDERVKAAKVRAWGGIIATVLSVVLTVTISILVTRTGSNQGGVPLMTSGAQNAKKLAGLSSIKKISGGKYEASGAVAVPDAAGILFVDDSRPDHVFYMPVNDLGEQDGPVKAIPLGVSVMNPEGITQFGPRFMIIGSLSTQESNEQGGIAVFNFDAAAQTVSQAVVLTGMRKFLFDNVPELKAWASKTSMEGGLNIEGITVDPDPQHPRVLLGLRGPVLNGNALIVPVRVRDQQAPLSIENLVMDEPNAIELNLNGQAIRDLQYDNRLRSFLIISGAPETEEKTNFTLWEWNGESNQASEAARPKQQAMLDKKMKPEGVTHLKAGNQEFVFIVGDANSYMRIDYISP